MEDEVEWIRRFYLEWAWEGGVWGREFMERGREGWFGRDLFGMGDMVDWIYVGGFRVW